MKISVIIPFLNETENLGRVVEELNARLEEIHAYAFEVIFVDDGSTDDSCEVLKRSSIRSFSCKVIRLSRNFGSHAALRAGIRHATGDYITFLYADLQDPPTLIPRMITEAMKGFDIVWAERSSTQAGYRESLFSRTYAHLMQRYVTPAYPQKGFDVVMFSRAVQEQLNANIEANSSVFLQILTMGFRQTSISYDKQERKAGKSKWTLGKKIKLFVDSFVAFSFAPIRMVTLAGFAFFLFGLLWLAYILLRKWLFDDLEAGWPALMSVLLLGFGITNISLGIIAEYLWRTLDASRRRPVFIISEMEELKS